MSDKCSEILLNNISTLLLSGSASTDKEMLHYMKASYAVNPLPTDDVYVRVQGNHRATQDVCTPVTLVSKGLKMI